MLALTVVHGPELKGCCPMMPDDATSLPVPACPQGSPRAPTPPSLLRLSQHEGLGGPCHTGHQGTTSCMEEVVAGREKPTTTGGGVENLLSHRGAALPSSRSISLSQVWKNTTPGCSPAVVFRERSCSPAAGCLWGIQPQYLLSPHRQQPKSLMNLPRQAR